MLHVWIVQEGFNLRSKQVNFFLFLSQLDPDGHIERTTVIRVVTTDDDEYKVG